MDIHSISVCNYYSSVIGIKCKIIKYKAHYLYIHDKGNGFPGPITVTVSILHPELMVQIRNHIPQILSHPSIARIWYLFNIVDLC